MHKLMESIRKELKEIENENSKLNSSSLEALYKLTSTMKNLYKIKECEEKEEKEMYDYYDRYDDERNRRGYKEDYDRRRYDERERGRERGGYWKDPRMKDHIDKITDGVEMYEYGKERYQRSGDDSRVTEGLDKLMYALCMFIDEIVEYAETPQEKEIIRKHIQKIKNV